MFLIILNCVFICGSVRGLHVSTHVCAWVGEGSHQCQIFLELELQWTVSCLTWVLRTEVGSSLRAVHTTTTKSESFHST